VADAAEVRAEWFQRGQVVGLTAGTSTPERVIEDVQKRLESIWCAHKVTLRETCVG
jgi:4-hydroxy-3-methylbut-2-enyl diphosphate reductase IspH